MLSKKLNTSIRHALNAIRKEPPMRGSVWANTHFYLSKESSYNEERWTGFPPQNIMIDLICADGVEQVNIMKSARVGFSKILLIALGYFQVHRKRNQAIWQSTDADAIDFSKTQINTMLRDVPVVREAFKNSFERKCPENTNSMKIFDNKTVMHIRGARSAKNFRAISVDNAYLDELASYDPNPDGEGSPVLLAKKRTSGSIFPKLVCGSTPKMAGSCLMEFEFTRSDYQMRFFIPCPYCDTMHPLTWSGMKWDKGQPETVKHECPNCKQRYDQNQYLDVWEKMRLQDEHGNYYHDGEFFNSKGELLDTPRSVGIHLWSAYIPQQTWVTLVREWYDCYKDPVTLRTFINTTLGEVDHEGAEAVAAHELQKRAELDFETLPIDIQGLTIGVDVQGDRLEFEIVGWSEKEESWSVDYQILWGDPMEDDVWQELLNWIQTTYEREDGEVIPISMVLIDSGFLASRVYQCIDKMGLNFVFASKGVAGNRPVVEHETDRRRRILKSKKKGGHPVLVGIDEAKIIIYKRMAITEKGAGYMHFPKSRHADWYDQLTVEKLKTKYQKGFPINFWFKPDGARNEALDCRVYAYAAFKMLNGRYRQTKVVSGFVPRIRTR